ncbi:hypothetical protein [Chitinophaga filiformis]|uniref:Preprotein translocase subunit SecB n=1 Tax=Chitinophaga filiformis TaxID=104663 RepID=A0ABY4I257_CHIFI|nr:hypothetical protein [Chitinophaga filiformis]UPK69705.1 hypothetical protein MYF79_00190 [Chitinophaga filiformis]
MPSTENIVDVKYGINFAKTLSFSYKSMEVLELQEIDLTKLKVKFVNKIEVNKNLQIIEIDFGTNFFNDKDIELLEYSLRMNYHILNFEEAVVSNSDPQTYEIHDRLMLHLMGLTISTARGILISHLMNTDYKNIFIPVFSESEIEKLFFSGKKEKSKE